MIEPLKRMDMNEFPQFWEQTIEAFNELIREKWQGKEARIYQKDVVDRILSKLPVLEDEKSSGRRDLIFETHQLDVEDLYRKQGFKVSYDKPGYNETYEPYWIFK
jgi:hypothetical protein